MIKQNHVLIEPSRSTRVAVILNWQPKVKQSTMTDVIISRSPNRMKTTKKPSLRRRNDTRICRMVTWNHKHCYSPHSVRTIIHSINMFSPLQHWTKVWKILERGDQSNVKEKMIEPAQTKWTSPVVFAPKTWDDTLLCRLLQTELRHREKSLFFLKNGWLNRLTEGCSNNFDTDW